MSVNRHMATPKREVATNYSDEPIVIGVAIAEAKTLLLTLCYVKPTCASSPSLPHKLTAAINRR